jgi:transcriptional regulator with XRE-family HTH domain
MSTERKECVEFGKTLRGLRTEQGYTQEAFADKAEIHRTYIGGIERGERNPTLTMIHRLAEALGVPPSRLLYPDCTCNEDQDTGDVEQPALAD